MRSNSIIALLTLCASVRLTSAQEVPPQQLLDLSASTPLPAVSSPQVTLARPATGEEGLAVSITPGKDGYPGIKLKPTSGDVWNLASYGHIAVKVTNTGQQQLVLNVRVDNPIELNDRPWNTEMKKLAPGQTETVTVVFGYTFGGIGYPVKADRISMITVFALGKDAPQSFKIDSIAAGGPPGERIASADRFERIKPKDNVLLNASTEIKPHQIEVAAGAIAQPKDNSIDMTFTKPSAKQSVSYKPAKGRWHLGESNQLRIELKNAGSSPLTPSVTLVSDMGASPATEGKLLAPGESAEMIVKYAAVTPWQGLPTATYDAAKSTAPGTGTEFASDKTSAIRFTIASDGDAPAQLQVSSIIGEVAKSPLPDWVGQHPPGDGEWEKTFEDNFDGNAIDLTKWNNTGPNYWDKVSHWSKDNVIVDGGVAKLREEVKTGTHNDLPNGQQTNQAGGYLDTFDKFRQRYGYFEARMKLPTAPGLWPAFWLMPDRGPNAGDKPGSRAIRCSTENRGMEFDIMEHLNVLGPYRYNIAMHWDNYGATHKHNGTGRVYFEPDADGYITTGLLWLPGKVTYYCQGKEVAHWEDPRISSVPEYMMFTIPIGGWDGNVSDGTGFPDDLVIDYVRVWQRKDLMSQSTDTTPPADAETALK